MNFDELMQVAVERQATDVLLVPGVQPALHVAGVLQRLEGPVLGPDDAKTLLERLVGATRFQAFEARRHLDFAFTSHDRRIRGSAFSTQGHVGVNLRLLPLQVPTPEQLGLPPVVPQFAKRAQGLLVFTGATGQGKSTTQASLVDLINRTSTRHVVTLEDPIEYVHHNQKGVVDQRELGVDFFDFREALRGVERQRPDVVLVGEMRDRETMQATLTLAETGHLVLTTLHTGDAVQAIPRLVESFPPEQQGLVRNQVADVLTAVVNQRLVKTHAGPLALAAEVLVNTPATANLIRLGHTEQLYGQMEVDAKSGNQTMNRALQELVSLHRVTHASVEPYLVSHESRSVPSKAR